MTDTLLGFAINLHGFFIAYAQQAILFKKPFSWIQKKGNKNILPIQSRAALTAKSQNSINFKQSIKIANLKSIILC